MSQSNFVTTSIPYVNSKPHVGFALELVPAHVDEHALIFEELSRSLSISVDRFVRTTSVAHVASVNQFWKSLRASDLYRKKYGGYYCVGCEDFLHEVDLKNGVCHDQKKTPNWIEEENIFFRLSSYQDQVREFIESNRIRITPSFRKKEILNFIDNELDEISISRERSRIEGWGIPVPGDDNQIIYVWIDALINYLSDSHVGTSGNKINTWPNLNNRKIHFIGKNAWKFHAIYWPALRLSAGLELPDEIVIHGFLTLDGKKISKPIGNVIDPIEVIKEFGSDSLRFYLLRAFSPFEDGDFAVATLKACHNSCLVNGLGNLLSRLVTLAARQGSQELKFGLVPETHLKLDLALKGYRFDEAVKVLWLDVDSINAVIGPLEP